MTVRSLPTQGPDRPPASRRLVPLLMYRMVRTVRMKPAYLRSALVGAAFCAILATAAAPVVAQQPLSSQLELRSSDAGQALAAAMSRLATDPRDVQALIAAGEAALQLDDPRSALGFFGRADDVSSNNGRVKAGLGRAMLQLDQVGDGLRLMEQAGNLGYRDAGLLGDRGLGRDLTGNQRGAQQDYAAALALDPGNDKVVRRLAVSYGIVGQVDLAEATLKPLLYKSDRAAWRDRAFILAMNGRTVQAMDIANKVMPKPLAGAIKPYMERMSMLTPGQRAAAVHMGQFPPGLIDRPVVIVPPSAPQTAAAPTPQTANGSRKGRAGTQVATTRTPARPVAAAPVSATTPSPTAVAPARPAQPAPVASQQPVRAATTPTPQPAATPTPAPQQSVRPAAAAAPTQTASVAVAKPVQGPPAPAAAAPSAPVALPPAAAQPPAAASDRTLAQIMAEVSVPEEERRTVVAPVNLAEIAAMQEAQRKARVAAEERARKAAEAKEAARRKAEADAKAKAEKKRLADNPARYWVQIGVGRNKAALAFTLRRMQKEHSVLAKKEGWSASWGATNRLVVGPFATLAKAKDVEAEMKTGGSDAFVWRSDAGEELEKVGG